MFLSIPYFAGFLLLALLVGVPTASADHDFRALVFSKTAGFRHDSIPAGISMIQSLGSTNHFAVDATEDAAVFNTPNLAQYSVLIFLNTTGDILNASQQSAFEDFIQAGGGYVGVHAASDTEYSWPWYGQLVGAYFDSHPAIQTADVLVCDKAHPSCSMLPDRWTRTDEWYNFQSNPRGSVHVLATLDESTYNPGGGAMGFDHPIAWCHEFDGGRSWYTGGGHTIGSYSEPLFRQHVLGGILWAAGQVSGDAGATIDSNYQKVILDGSPSNPMELAVAGDGRVFIAERGGAVKIWKPDTGTTVVAGTIPVFAGLEDGLLGVTLDPGFDTNNWVYLFYSPSGATPKQHISRFTMDGDTLDLNSEEVVLIIPTQRDECCHSGGSMTFGPDGALYISTGDNTNPFESSGYSPIDERAGRSAWDAQKSSSDANDLRGKILRILPQSDGSYTIPAGNLFPPGTPNTRPEIYVMGCRNPFRISVDAETGWLYWGEVGPDANNDNGNRGAMGHDEWNQARAPGNFGWPYFVGDNKAYRDYDFASSTSGSYFVASAPTNASPNNTGPQVLPPAMPAMIWYPYGAAPEFPELGSGARTAMAGPVYHVSANSDSSRRLPAYFEDTLFIYEWSRNYIKEVKLDQNGDILAINPFLPSFTFNRPMEMEIGPDGAIYMIEWGTGFGGDNADAQVIRIDYVAGNRAPVIVASATPDSGDAPLLVQFSSDGTYDPDPQDTLRFAWSFFGGSVTNSTNANPSFTYTNNGNYTPQLRVHDSAGNVSVANFTITVGNNRPLPWVSFPPNGAVYDWGDTIGFAAGVFDVEDGSTTNGAIACSDLLVQLDVGHNDHSHGIDQTNACVGEFHSPPGHGDEGDNTFLVFRASYTDQGAPNAPPLTGTSTSLVHPRRKQAQHYSDENGVGIYLTGDNNGVVEVIDIDHGDWISFNPLNFTNLTGVDFRVASAGSGGQIELRLDATNGTLLASATVPATGNTYTNISTTFADPGGTHELFLVFSSTPPASDLFRLNWMEFIGDGVGVAPPPDTKPPVINIVRPASGVSFLSGQTFPFEARVTDEIQVAEVEFFVDGAMQTIPSVPPYRILVSGLSVGPHTLSVQAEDFSGNRSTNTISITVTTGSLPSGPYGGVPQSIPGRIEVEDFNQGGHTVAYFDNDPGNNNGGQYRNEGVDMEVTTDPTGGNVNVGWISSGEWLTYAVNTIGGTYDIHLRAASPIASAGSVTATLDGETIGIFPIPTTGAWQSWTDVTVSGVDLGYRTNVTLMLSMSGPGGDLHNLNYIDFVALSTNPPPALPPVLEWTGDLGSGFVDAPGAVLDTNTGSIMVPKTGDTGFYRLRSNYPYDIIGVESVGTNLVIDYE